MLKLIIVAVVAFGLVGCASVAAPKTCQYKNTVSGKIEKYNSASTVQIKICRAK